MIICVTLNINGEQVMRFLWSIIGSIIYIICSETIWETVDICTVTYIERLCVMSFLFRCILAASKQKLFACHYWVENFLVFTNRPHTEYQTFCYITKCYLYYGSTSRLVFLYCISIEHVIISVHYCHSTWKFIIVESTQKMSNNILSMQPLYSSCDMHVLPRGQ